MKSRDTEPPASALPGAEGDRIPLPMTTSERATLLLLLAIGLLSTLYFAEFWFLSPARRTPFYFELLSLALFWGVFRSWINWGIYFFITPPLQRGRSRDYSVDVLTTAMPGEPYAMFVGTLEAIQNISTPHETYLLDGGNDARLKKLCAQLGVHHIDCSGVGGAKAGKLNHCLTHHCEGEVVFIVDPDHRPRPDFLERTLGWFDEQDVGFIQVVQAYYNREASFVASAAAEQTYGFYGPTLLGLNGLGIPTAIGANCIFRRAALGSIGGHAVHLAEDALTSMRLHARGWRSVYVPYRGTEGLVPEDVGSFFKQQMKWATGMFYLLFREYPRLFRRFPIAPRVHYFCAGTFYFSGVATSLTMVLPIWFLFAQVFAVEFDPVEFALHLAPYAISVTLIYVFVQRWYTHTAERRVPWRAMVLERSTWYIYLVGLLAGVLNRTVRYLPTPKESERSAALALMAPNIAIVLLSVGAIVFALSTYHRLGDGAWLMIFFAGLNVVLLLPVIFVASWPRLNWSDDDGTS